MAADDCDDGDDDDGDGGVDGVGVSSSWMSCGGELSFEYEKICRNERRWKLG
jgi:hypothetical protein